MTTRPDASAEADRFFALLKDGLVQNSWTKLALGKYRGLEPQLKNVVVRPVRIQGQDCLSFVYRYPTRDITKNTSIPEGIEVIRQWLGRDFLHAHLLAATGDVHLTFNKKGKCCLKRGKPSSDAAPDRSHDRDKHRVIDPAAPFLTTLGITNEQRQVIPSMSRKWKQINVFIQILQQAFQEAAIDKAGRIEVVDFGAGKGYLTFAVYDFLKNQLGLDVQVTGVEARGELAAFCNEAARNHGMEGLRFLQGDVESYRPETIHVMIALHACDTATDLALHMGIRAGAGILLCAPCCHKELRPQLQSPPVLLPVLRHGVHLGLEAEMITDSLRALLLEAAGYDTRVFEFISLEHTGKNKMILANRRPAPGNPEAVLAQISALKEFYGIREQYLETLLRTSQ